MINVLQALENSPETPEQQQCVNSNQCSSVYDEAFLNDFSDSDNWCGSDITVCNAYFSHFIVNMLSVTIY